MDGAQAGDGVILAFEAIRRVLVCHLTAAVVFDVVGVDESLAARHRGQGPVAEESGGVQKRVRLLVSLVGEMAGARHLNRGTPDLLFAHLVVLLRVGRLLVPASLCRNQKHPLQAQLRHVVVPIVPQQAGRLVVLATHCANV